MRPTDNSSKGATPRPAAGPRPSPRPQPSARPKPTSKPKPKRGKTEHFVVGGVNWWRDPDGTVGYYKGNDRSHQVTVGKGYTVDAARGVVYGNGETYEASRGGVRRRSGVPGPAASKAPSKAPSKPSGGRRPGGALTNKDDLQKLHDEAAADLRGVKHAIGGVLNKVKPGKGSVQGHKPGGALTNEDDLKQLGDGLKRDVGKLLGHKEHIYTGAELYQIIRKAGASVSEARTMAAIALAESSGKPSAFEGHARGLWQIDDRYHDYDHARAMSDVNYNAKLAVEIMRDAQRRGKDPFSPWSTYKNGAYKKHVNAATASTPTTNAQVPSAGAAAAGTAAAAAPAAAAAAAPAGSDANSWSGWGDPGDRSNMTHIRVNGVEAVVHKGVAARFQGLLTDLWNAGYHYASISSFSDRNIAGSAKKSNHAWGAAIDIDADANPRYGSGAGGQHRIPDELARSLAKKWGMAWGGDYKSSKDYMHFEAIGAPATYGSPPGGSAPPPLVVDGTEASGGAGVDTPEPVNVDDVLAAAGFSKALLASDPSLRAVVDDIIRTGITDQDQWRRKIQQTSWWQKRTSAQRAYDMADADKASGDHLDLSRSVEVQRQAIIKRASALGMPMSGLAAHDLAVIAVRNGLIDSEIDQAIGKAFHPKTGVAYGGTLGTTLENLRKAAADYMVTIPDATLTQWAQKVATGGATPEQYTEFIKGEAIKKFPHLKSQLDAGLTARDIASSYKGEIGRVLEIDPNSIKDTDPWVMKAIQYKDPAAKEGAYTTMPLWKLTEELKSDPRWLQTDNARTSLMGATKGILQDFGFKF